LRNGWGGLLNHRFLVNGCAFAACRPVTAAGRSPHHGAFRTPLKDLPSVEVFPVAGDIRRP
jgi:hypothetical protein